MFIDEIKALKTDKKEIQKFSFSVGTVLILIAVVLFLYEKEMYVWFISAGAILILSGLLYYRMLKPLYLIWMGISLILGWISTRVILFLLFYLILTPVKLIAVLSGKKFLVMKPDKKLATYWIKREKKVFDPVDYEKQY